MITMEARLDNLVKQFFVVAQRYNKANWSCWAGPVEPVRDDEEVVGELNELERCILAFMNFEISRLPDDFARVYAQCGFQIRLVEMIRKRIPEISEKTAVGFRHDWKIVVEKKVAPTKSNWWARFRRWRKQYS